MEQKNDFRSKLHRFIDKLGTMALMNFMFIIACIPVLTIGPAWSGLLTAVRHYVRGDKWFAGFKFGYKTRFWRSFLSWNLMLLPIAYFLPEINHHLNQEQFVPLLFSALIFLMLIMFSTALLVLNVYIPTRVSRWIRNGADLIKGAPLQLAVCALLIWLPVLLFLFLFSWDMFFFVLIIFIAAYFTLTAIATTLLLKGKLVEFLVDARSDGELLAEEGKARDD